ncbi:mannonate dehydratase [Falsirhodobacter sp. 20TX0035]|uniref:mannonate dehydratase n=1 Tax=Falsirhodobacter sp. 20TX0035 TaxID=3022019 RepID=UPI00232B3B80|nr:mannonate dehydratase [Falsirhodobacter sp. 20TX0035]MDB6454385.1 mannonate dehydratase [Falsirhodobacter sp. 20TX0035]
MEQTWRWFGPDDAVGLHHIVQAGATGVVTALHQIPYGEVWTPEAIATRKAIVEDPAHGLRWSVVESLPIHERVKLGDGDLSTIFDNYRTSMRNLAAAGVNVICYNFMPILDWTRTQLDAPLPGGGTALRFNHHEYVAFDLHMLKRPGADEGVPPEVLTQAAVWFQASTEGDRDRLLANIMAGLPGAYDRYDIPQLREMLRRYDDISRDDLRANYARFLEEVIPTAEECGIRMCVHPDDPPRALFGLDRIVSTEDDIAFILNAVPSRANGLTLCSGSLGANPANDVPGIAARFADRVHFAHLRNVAKDPDGSFMEAEHLGGDTDMVKLIRVLMAEERRRRAEGRADWQIPMRPDHGHALIDDAARPTFPGYPIIGRLRGLAELRGVMAAVDQIEGA